MGFVIIDGGSGGCWHLGGCYQGCWGSLMSVTWQPRPVWFGVQEVRGEEMGGSLAYNGGLLLLLVAMLVLVDDCWWW